MAAEEWEVEFKQGTILAAKEWEVECGEQLIQDSLGKKERRKVGWKERKKERKKERRLVLATATVSPPLLVPEQTLIVP